MKYSICTLRQRGINIKLLYFAGLFVGPLSIMQSHRWTTSVGVLLMGTGAILSAFSKSSVDLYLSVGLVAGRTSPLSSGKVEPELHTG